MTADAGGGEPQDAGKLERVVVCQEIGPRRIGLYRWVTADGAHVRSQVSSIDDKGGWHVETYDTEYVAFARLQDMLTEHSKIIPADAVYMVFAWLSGRHNPVSFGGDNDISEAAQMATRFCTEQGLGSVSRDYPNNMVSMKE